MEPRTQIAATVLAALVRRAEVFRCPTNLPDRQAALTNYQRQLEAEAVRQRAERRAALAVEAVRLADALLAALGEGDCRSLAEANVDLAAEAR